MTERLIVCCESRRKAEPYARALASLGIDSDQLLLLTPEIPHTDLAALASHAAGVVLCGGPDLSPHWYGEEPRDDARLSILPDLDQMDWQLLEGAAAGRTPVWAICRGMQTLNVFQGGTLWQDLPSQRAGTVEHRPDMPHDALAHSIHITDRSTPLGERLAPEVISVNSRHHQAIRRLGRDVRPLAESPDGVVEVAVLDRQDWWARGVQWHPENLMHIPLQRQLWSEFLYAVGDRATCGAETRNV